MFGLIALDHRAVVGLSPDCLAALSNDTCAAQSTENNEADLLWTFQQHGVDQQLSSLTVGCVAHLPCKYYVSDLLASESQSQRPTAWLRAALCTEGKRLLADKCASPTLMASWSNLTSTALAAVRAQDFGTVSVADFATIQGPSCAGLQQAQLEDLNYQCAAMPPQCMESISAAAIAGLQIDCLSSIPAVSGVFGLSASAVASLISCSISAAPSFKPIAPCCSSTSRTSRSRSCPPPCVQVSPHKI